MEKLLSLVGKFDKEDSWCQSMLKNSYNWFKTSEIIMIILIFLILVLIYNAI